MQKYSSMPNNKKTKKQKVKSPCKHKKQEKIDYGTNKCKNCGRLINTLGQNIY